MDDKTNQDPTLAYAAESGRPNTRPSLRVLFEGGRGVVDRPLHYIDQAVLPIGRAVGDDGLRLDDTRASRQHATVHTAFGGNQIELVDTSSNGTFLEGARIRRITLRDNSIIQVGNSFLLFRFEPDMRNDATIDSLVGDAPSMRQLRRAIVTVAPTDATVLISGESGTGKELVARALHDASGRNGSFIAVNCSAIPESLAESQLFGHVAGAFTGASGSQKGYFEAAHRGTLFLDELGELSASLQPKLLRVLEEHVVTPLGSSQAHPVDVRVIAATNVNLGGAMQARRFRGDLYARIAEITLSTPPLRERREDILPLLVRGLGGKAPPLSPKLAGALLLYSWPFNVRELLKLAKHMQIYSAGEQQLELSLVADRLVEMANPSAPPPDVPDPSAPGEGSPDQRESSDYPSGPREPVPSRDELIEIIKTHKGNISKVSRALNRSRRQIYRYLEMYEIDIGHYR
ncbi:MAG: sigma 54-interacting transcriptional regulator [Proteobacteria bacterium]|nr:sigma 54-interacting transcriptional regulator [Pseudomonadota bacterium]